MGINTIPVVENGMMYIRGVNVELLATPSQTWDLAIRGVVYHITQEQEASFLRAVLYHKDRPSPSRIAQLSYSGKIRKLPSPALMAQMITISHTCIDDTNTRKPCSEVFGIRGYGYMSKWRQICHCAPYSIAIWLWLILVILMWYTIKWLFNISPGTPFSVDDTVMAFLIQLGVLTAIELCFKSGRKYICKWLSSKWLWFAVEIWMGSVLATAIQCHKTFMEQVDNLPMALAPIIAVLGGLFIMIMSAMNLYLLVDHVIKEGEDLDTIDKYV